MPDSALPRRAAAYIRVSTDDQTELSPDSQLEEIQKYAHREGLALLNDHIYIDAGISGKRAERRPEFMRMIARAKGENCPFSVILLWKFSRFARNQEESIFYKSILRSKCGIDVVSVTEPLIAGPFGSLIERIIEWMDEFYSIRLSQEVKRSMTVNAQRGRLQAPPSFGYRAEGGRLVPQEAEAVHVRRIFDAFVAGSGPQQIAKELNALGVHTHRANPFEARAIEYILRNPVYIGKLRWNPAGRSRRDFFDENIIVSDGAHQPLISAETWRAAQERMDRLKAQSHPHARPAGERRHWLSGVVRCSACGGPLVFTKPHYFKCNNYIRARCTHSQHVNADRLAQDLLSRIAQDAQGAAPVIFDLTRPSVSGACSAKEVLRRLHAKKARLQAAYLAGVWELSDFAAAKKSLDTEIDLAQEALAAQQAEPNQASALRTSIATALETLHSPAATVQAQNLAIRAVLSSCIFDKSTATLTIVYRFEL
ncbi:MAG: recombinase family protein [Oscillospiraceae bacterium]|nr:recombinase family protein [Oscillospiraceae bacterium]